MRLLGVQEPASALFSVLNAATILYGFVHFKVQAPTTYPYHTIVCVQFIVSIVMSQTIVWCWVQFWWVL